MDNSTHPFQGIEVLSVLRSYSVSHTLYIQDRRSSCLILKVHGVSEYRMGGQTLQLSAGELLFVEKGSSYVFQEIAPGYCYIVNFVGQSQLSSPLAKLPLPTDFELQPLAEKLFRQWQKENVYGALSTLYGLLAKTTAPQLASRTSQTFNKHLSMVLTYLQEHLTDPELTVEALSDHAGVSDAYLRRVFKRQLGTSPANFVLHERMLLAAQLLLSNEDIHVAEVALQVGYRDPLYFSRVFKKHFGLAPTEYCKINREFLF